MRSPRDSELPAFLKAAYIFVPIVAWLPSLPVLTSLPSELRAGHLSTASWILGGITVGGLVAAPGYFYALLSDSLLAVPRARRNVIRVSLLLAASVAIAGVPWALFLAWPLTALPLLAIVACTHLIVRCESAWRNPRLALGLVASVLLLLVFVLGSFLLATGYELAGPSDCKELRFASLGELRTPTSQLGFPLHFPTNAQMSPSCSIWTRTARGAE